MTQHDADNAKVCVSKGCGAQSHIPHHGQENGRQERNEQTVSKSPYHRPATSAGNVAVNPAVAPQKKWGTRPGTMTLKPNSGQRNILTSPATKLARKPTMTAFGAKETPSDSPTPASRL